MAAAAGTVLAGAVTATMLATGPTGTRGLAAPRPFAMAGDLGRASDPGSFGMSRHTTVTRPATAAAPPAPAPAAPTGSPQQIAMAMLADFGWSSSQFGCLDPLWERESGWNPYAANPSGAYGIPQALPGSKMASAGADWATDAATQIRWGLGYIRATYGSPCGAWAHETAYGWY